MKPLKVFKVLAMITLAVVLMPLVIPTLSPFSVGGQVSYNPPPGDIFHAPLSGMGLLRLVQLQDNVSAMIGGSATSSSVSNPSGPQARGNGLQSINQRALRFINDTSYFPQSETTIAVDPSNPQHVVGGFNDAKFLFCQVFSADCTPSGSPASLSGFTVSIDGGLSVLKGSDIPDFNITAISFPPTVFPMIAFGDPTIVPSGDGNFLYSSLATSRDGGNGIMIAKSNSNLFDPNVSCVTSNIAPTVNACWKEIFVYGRTSIFSPTLEDKPVMAVDHGKGVYSGSVYVGWDHFTFGRATSFGPPNTILSFMGQATALPYDTITLGFATEQFRTASIPWLAADTSSTPSAGNLYFTIQVCTSGVYLGSPLLGADNPGNCGLFAVLFSASPDRGASWSSRIVLSKPAVNAQPYVTVDPTTGNIFVVYYTTQFDSFNHRIDVVASKSTNGGSSFHQSRITSVSNEPDSDPNMFFY